MRLGSQRSAIPLLLVAGCASEADSLGQPVDTASTTSVTAGATTVPVATEPSGAMPSPAVTAATTSSNTAPNPVVPTIGSGTTPTTSSSSTTPLPTATDPAPTVTDAAGGTRGFGGSGAAGEAPSAGGTPAASDGGSPGAVAGAPGSGGEPGTGPAPVTSVQLVGYATQGGGTTGGQGGETVTATTYQELLGYAESSEPYVIQIEGTLSNGANGGRIRIASNKTLLGIGSTAFLDGVGLEINGGNNIIVQNLRISLTGVTTRTDTDGVYSSTGDEGSPQILVNGGDAISISGSSRNIWIDHCELFSEDPAVQTNRDLYDGLIDIKNQAAFITISWCHFHNHHKGNLIGSSDSDLFDDRKITFHHNFYDNVKLRVPTYRGAEGHFFNNYVVGAEDATEIRAGTCLRVEKNYYEALHYSIYTPSDAPGSTERIDNVEVDREDRAYPDDCSVDIPYDYRSVLTDAPEDVKALVPGLAGVGKL